MTIRLDEVTPGQLIFGNRGVQAGASGTGRRGVRRIVEGGRADASS
jgi:hypothetical protein